MDTKCPDCRGTGLNPQRPLSLCPTCGGCGDMAAHIRARIKAIHREHSPLRRLKREINSFFSRRLTRF